MRHSPKPACVIIVSPAFGGRASHETEEQVQAVPTQTCLLGPGCEERQKHTAARLLVGPGWRALDAGSARSPERWGPVALKMQTASPASHREPRSLWGSARLLYPPHKGFQLRVILPPRISGDIFGCHSWGWRCCWHLVGAGQSCCDEQDSVPQQRMILSPMPAVLR